MKVLFSTTKTMKKATKFVTDFKYLFDNKTSNLIAKIKKLTIQELSQMQKTSIAIATNVYQMYHDMTLCDDAMSLFNGIMYKMLDYQAFNNDDLDFLNNNVFIISALYGLVKPNDLIANYRLNFDEKTKQYLGIDLYEYWQELNEYIFNLDHEIISLMSNEFDKLLSHSFYKCEFKVIKNNQLKHINTIAKQARGLMLKYIVKYKIDKIEDVKKFNELGFKFDRMINNTLLFIKA